MADLGNIGVLPVTTPIIKDIYYWDYNQDKNNRSGTITGYVTKSIFSPYNHTVELFFEPEPISPFVRVRTSMDGSFIMNKFINIDDLDSYYLKITDRYGQYSQIVYLTPPASTPINVELLPLVEPITINPAAFLTFFT